MHDQSPFMVEPGMPPPAGMVSDFDNPDREMYYICIVSNAIAIPVCTLFVGLRLYARYKLSMRLQADDIACILGYLGFLAYCGICLSMLRFGGGLHQWEVPKPQVTGYMITVYATMVNYGPTVFAIKAAILLFLIKIFSPYKTYIRWIYGFIGVLGMYYALMFFLKIFMCRPIPMFWDATTEGKCFNQELLMLVDNIISLVSDIIVLILPCPLTKDLKVGTLAKVKIMAVFGLGGVACIFSLLRLVFLVQNHDNLDQTYVFVKINLTGIAECGIGIVCACLPLMPGLWKSILQKNKEGYTSNGKSQFEMMDSQEMNTRRTNRTRNKSVFQDNESDENDLIMVPGAGDFKTTVRGGHDVEGESAGSGSGENKLSHDEQRILRTVEVRQVHETPPPADYKDPSAPNQF